MIMENGGVRFGIVGTGAITGWFLSGAMQDERFRLVGVCSRSINRAQEMAKTYGAELAFSDIREMAACPEIDAIYIAVPNSEHYRYALTCIRAGKHVLVEKPAASNAAELSAMISAASEQGVTLMEAMLPTTSPNFQILRRNLARIGRPRRYFAAYCQYSSRYERMLRGDVASVFSREMSGGATMDIGVYTIQPMIALFGMPESISAQATMLPTGVDGQAAVNFGYQGMNATVIYSKIADSYLPTEIEGETGNLMASTIHVVRDAYFIPHRKPTSGQGPDPERESIGVKLDKSDYFYETAEFINTVLAADRSESRLNTLSNSLATLKVTDEIRRQIGLTFPADK